MTAHILFTNEIINVSGQYVSYGNVVNCLPQVKLFDLRNY